MSNVVKGLKNMFFGDKGAERRARKDIAINRERQLIEGNRQLQESQATEARAMAQAGQVSRAPRGRRLLLADTGERGLSSTLG